MTDATAKHSANEITEQAANWIERRSRESWSASDEVHLQDWLFDAPANRIAFWRLESAWSETSRLTALRQPEAHRVRRETPRRKLPMLSNLAVAATVVVALGLLTSSYFSSRESTYSTALGERKILTLADGSQIELNTNTILRAAITAGARKVWLDKGEAYFSVKHDTARPFEVIVSGRRITDLGTKFNVREEGNRLRVTVLQGRVSFDERDGSAPTELKPGDIVTSEAGKLSLTRVPTQELTDRLSWRSGKLMFHHAPLSEIAAEFNRYNVKKIVISGEGARSLTVNGTFATNDVQAFARIARTILGLQVDDQGSRVVISH